MKVFDITTRFHYDYRFAASDSARATRSHGITSSILRDLFAEAIEAGCCREDESKQSTKIGLQNRVNFSFLFFSFLFFFPFTFSIS